MRVRATAAVAAMLVAALTACGGGGSDSQAGGSAKAAASKPAKKKDVDCTDENLSQADWIDYCSDTAAGTGGDGREPKSKGLKFGTSYTWPDGLKVSVAQAKVFTNWDKELLESASPGQTDFRINLKIENTGKSSFDLSTLSTIVEGATDGGEAAGTIFERGSSPLEGRLAAGRTVTKTDDNELETRFGKAIVVTVQRSTDDLDTTFPEFEGTITS